VQDKLLEAERRIEEARRTEAEWLDLGDLALSELPASLGDLPHLKTLCLGMTGLTEAGEREYDDERMFAEFADLQPLAKLQSLQNLDLTGTGVTDLQPLAGLKALQSLSLFDTGISDLQPLARLHALHNLDLAATSVSDLRPLDRLRELQDLDLSDSSVSDLRPLAELGKLRKLSLTFNRGISDLQPLDGLRELQDLGLSDTCVSNVQPLAGLRKLRTLDLSLCSGILDVRALDKLRELQDLDLSNTGVVDLQPLAELRKLRRLNLSLCGVSDLRPLNRLGKLQHLDLSDTKVADLQPLAELQKLQSLNLSYCSDIADLRPLSRFQALQSLELYGCRCAVPAEIVRIIADYPHLAKLVVDEAVGVPREVLSRTSYDNCLSRLRAYLAELNLKAEADSEVKVILLGNGFVGKTQFCRRFRGQPFDSTITSTHGVQIWREKLRIRTAGHEEVFQINWWDFGGQDIYHGTHALFLRSRAVFVILWAPHLENHNEYLENGVALRNQPLAYWLNYVRTLAGEDSPVIVVQSQCDRITDRRPPPARLDSPGFFEASYSAKEDLGRATLEAHLRDAVRYLEDRHGPLKIGQRRAEVRRQLYDLRSKDQKREAGKRRHRTLTLDEFRALCDKVGDVASWEHALDYFHETGVVFYQPDLFANHIILDQDWALDAVYTVFHRGRAAPWLRDSGRFTREDLAWMVWQEYSSEEQKLFFHLMESCGVCFRCGETSQGEPCYIAPDLLPTFEAVKGRLHAWKEEPGTPMLRLEYRFFHQAIIRGLMSSIGRRAGTWAEYWKYGFWFKDGRRDSQILVQFEDTSTDEAPGAGALVLKALGQDPLGLLREVCQVILWQRIGEKPEELLTLEGTTVARSELAAAIDFHNKPVPPAAFAFFEGRRHNLREPTMANISPEPLTEHEKPREVFISYAWGDDTPEGKSRAQMVDELQSALEKNSFIPVRDRDRLHPGDRISAFMRQLTHADLVVAVISDKYLRSTNCMYEIYRLWQRWQSDANAMARCVVPIVLPEVRVGSFPQRAPYLKHWSDQAKSLEELVRDPDLRPSSQSWEEVRLVREFAHHIDDILVFLNDVLMPRQLQAHLDHGFPAVLEALQHRISGK